MIHPDGLLLGTASDNVIKLWDLKTATSAAGLEHSHKTPLKSINFSENGYHLCSSSSSELTIWDLRKLSILHTLEFDAPVLSAKFDHSGKYLAALTSAGESGVVKIYTPKKMELVAHFETGFLCSSFCWKLHGGESRGIFASGDTSRSISYFGI